MVDVIYLLFTNYISSLNWTNYSAFWLGFSYSHTQIIDNWPNSTVNYNYDISSVWQLLVISSQLFWLSFNSEYDLAVLPIQAIFREGLKKKKFLSYWLGMY